MYQFPIGFIPTIEDLLEDNNCPEPVDPAEAKVLEPKHQRKFCTPSKHFLGTNANTRDDDSEHQTESDDDRLRDPLPLTWGATPPAAAPGNLTTIGAGLIAEVQAQLNLTEANLQLANRLFQATEEEKWRLNVLFFVYFLGKTPTAGQLDSPVVSTGAMPGQPTPFTFSNHIKCFMRDKLRQILVKANVNAYTRTMTLSDSTPIRRTPLLLLKLLYNIKEMNHRPIDGAVPSLDALVVVIDHNMALRKQLRAVDEIQRSYPDNVKTRLAFLRLYTVVHLIHRDPTQNISQWEMIDQQIEYVKKQSDLYRIAYGRVVRAIDHELFGQKKNFDCINHEEIRVPSEEDVEEEIRRMSTGDRSEGQSNPFG
ncbi:uncharacterized protein PGTG_10128 [Puccinia graminis f. sp. tritici CRL 75-36-700-3]|uniref:Uncharacterized protein n=1 Tax=Puccinia graminis f. sp. tritici (strain CRL 75-36-700-3 / race SCCL) TaxID=418459 RepID=E3KJD3_PUCGT|nr:uncharacterized protein PGTG_10128 [Puccinia graminis f. sp. tritici CRL 75-36-700-3]EFP84408.2 hypothetical protein PGTG_10128 [Puccinia graminis f. sp. tritici CRL 75-36-700-3]